MFETINYIFLISFLGLFENILLIGNRLKRELENVFFIFWNWMIWGTAGFGCK
jgi:hypothetical protein